MVQTKFVVFLCFMLISGIEMMPVDPTDQCIFNCYQCYSKANLVDCANDCIMMDGNVSDFWSKCKYFDNKPQVFSM